MLVFFFGVVLGLQGFGEGGGEKREVWALGFLEVTSEVKLFFFFDDPEASRDNNAGGNGPWAAGGLVFFGVLSFLIFLFFGCYWIFH